MAGKKGSAKKPFSKHLSKVEIYIAASASLSNQADQQFISSFLDVFKDYIEFWKLKNQAFEGTRKAALVNLVLKFEAAMDQLQKTGNVRILKHVVKLKNIVANGYFVPSNEVQVRVVTLATLIENYVKNGVPIHCSVLTEDFNIEVNAAMKTRTVPNNMPECDIHLYNLVQKARNAAIAKIKDENRLTVSIKHVLAKFANAIELYAAYGQTGVEHFYDRSVVCFSGIPLIIHLHCNEFIGLLKFVEKITNTIVCFTIPNYRIPSKVLVDELLLLLESMVKLLKIGRGSISIASSYLNISNTIPCSILVNRPDHSMINVINEKISDYKATIKPVETDNNTMRLQFSNIISYLSFAQDNEELVGTLNLLTKESLQQESIPQEALDELIKQLSEECKDFIRSKQSICDRVNKQLEEARDSVTSNAVQANLENDLRKEITAVYPQHRLHIFGSRASGQALPGSDFDFYCDVTGSTYLSGMDHTAQGRSVNKVGSQLQRNRKVFSHVELVTTARVPIVKLVHNPTSMDCDISFKDGTAVEATRLLNVYLDLDARVRWLLAAVKLWAHYNGIHSSRYFKSHCLSWLVLFYLMQKGLVPPVMELQASCEPKMINNWNVAFKQPTQWVPRTQASHLELFKGFFAWVVQANLKTVCLCPFTGDAIPKESLVKTKWMKNYKDGVFREYVERVENKRSELDAIRMKKNKKHSKFNLTTYDRKIEMNGFYGLCVQDPFDHSQNIAKPVEKVQYEHFIDISKKTNRLLTELE